MAPSTDIIFSEFLLKILPLYLIISLGFFAGKITAIDRKSVTSLLFYGIIPFVYFDFATKMDLEVKHLFIPFFVMAISFSMSITFLKISQLIWKNDARPNVIAFSAGTANTGYFGLPVALLLFDDQTVALFMLINVSLSLYDYSIGAYVIALGRYTYRDALIQVSRLPIIYAFMLGLAVGEMGYKLPSEFNSIVSNMMGSYIVIGLMIVGLSLSAIKTFKVDPVFILTLLSARFIGAPIFIIAFITLDKTFLHIFERPTHMAFMLFGFVPPAANTVVFATLYDCYPEETATSVLCGIILAMFYIPVAISVFF